VIEPRRDVFGLVAIRSGSLRRNMALAST